MQMMKAMAVTLALVCAAGCAELDPGMEESSEASDALESVPGGPTRLGYDSCLKGEVCFYTGPDGTGNKCSWTQYDEDWQGGNVRCSWSATSNACSIINKTPWRVAYFLSGGYANRIGSTAAGGSGNLQCTYKLRSHKWE